MISRYRISLGGVQLDELDDRILILDIGHEPPDRSIRKQTTANLDGVSIGGVQVGQRTITVTFEIHIYDIAERNRVCQRVNEWASKNGHLTINERPDHYLQDALCETFADISSAKNWTDPLTLVFSSTTNPYWQSKEASTLSFTGKTGSGNIDIDGNAGFALVSATFTAGATINSLQITVGETKMKLTGLNVPTGKTILIDYVEHRYMRIRANGASVLSKLDSSSSDNLLAECGKTTRISFTANNKVTAVFTARGCWL